MRYRIFSLAVWAASATWMGCSSKSTEPKTDATIQGKVTRLEDGVGISGANVVLYDADANAPAGRTSTDARGDFSFTVLPGNFYLTAAAQGRLPSPPSQGGKPLPFQAVAGGKYTRGLALEIDSAAVGTGGIAGSVTVSGTGTRGGILIVVTATGITRTTVTGPDGSFVLFNLPPGSYALNGFKAGLAQTAGRLADVASGAVTSGVSLAFTSGAGHTLNGRISFLASANSVVDITLVIVGTREAVPGLSTVNNASNSFTLTGIPPGDYIAWASFENDNYVMDPDRIQKAGLPFVTFDLGDTVKTLDFDVTDAVTLISPTNHADTLQPVQVAGTAPTFRWEKYPSAKEYIVEVFDGNGRRVWGGYDSTVILHPQVTAESASYNFDGAGAVLKPGGIYSWKVYADDDATPGVQTLISSSEDLRGLFQMVP